MAMRSAVKKNKRKSQREAARLQRQAEADLAMEEEEEIHFNQPENTPNTPRVSRSNTPDPEDAIQGEPSAWIMPTFGLLVMTCAGSAIVRA